MKRLITVLLVVFGISEGMAQAPYVEKYTNYFAIEGGLMASSTGLHFGPSFSIYRNKSKVDIGAAVMLHDIWDDGPGIAGAYLGYKYYPNDRQETWNLFFGYHMNFFVHDWGRKYPVICDDITDICKHPDYKFQWEAMLGIGFDVQLGNDFYMFNDWSAGALFDLSTYTDVESETELRSTGMIRLGIGYDIGKKRLR